MQPPTDQPDPPRYATEQLGHVAAALKSLAHPTQIGRYTVLEPLGEGGMGSVYKAEQTAPIRRLVAVKIIKLGMDTREVIARFESERQALAMMNHPNVARVLDAGATDTGRPYFVMEYVAGEPITAFADQQQLTIRDRLELFIQACEAVQHAHQKAIIHRDLKPSNILVTRIDGQPTVKVIDFGVAKALSQRLTERTLFTETGQLVGTPEYMPPEQADANQHADIDTRSDVYALGVVLYELLIGALPFDARTLRSAGYNEIQRIIREVDPPRPSTRLSGLGKGAVEVARLRCTAPDSLSKQLRSELEWIPLKAMRKERDARYSSAAELADDIRNYLASRPLRAGPESRAYRARKFLRRNWRGVAVACGMAGLLVGGTVATTVQAIRATRAERQALERTREAETQRQAALNATESLREVNRFLTEDLLGSAAPDVARGQELTVRQAVDRAAETVAQRFQSRPLIEAAVRDALAETYHELGLSEVGLPHAQAALAIFRGHYGEDHLSTLAATQVVGRLLNGIHRYDQAETILADAYNRSRRVLGEDSDVTLFLLNDLAISIRRQRQFAKAEPLYFQLLDLVSRKYGPESVEAGQILNGVSTVLGEQDRQAEAEVYLRRSLDVFRRQDASGTSYLTSLANHGKLLQRLGRIEEAEVATREALAGQKKLLKDDHPQTMLSMSDLAWILAEQGKFEEANDLAEESLNRRRRVLGEDHRDTLQSMLVFGRILTMQGRYDQAERMIRGAVEGRMRVLGETHAHTLGATAHLSTVYELQERYAEAEPLLAHVSRSEFASVLGAEQRRSIRARWGICLAKLKRFEEAEPVLAETLEELERSDRDDPLTRTVAETLEWTRDALNRAEDARANPRPIPGTQPDSMSR